MSRDNRKVVLVGAGMVGMSYAYALLNQNACDELVLIDIDEKRAAGEAMDLSHGLAFAGSHMRIYAGKYSDCEDADIVVICAGVAQKPGESRLDLLQRNTEVFRSVVIQVTDANFNGIFLVATNPVDIMTRITCELSGFNPKHVIGSGTTLDTARLRYLLGDFFSVDPRNVHAYVIGEHGDSEFVPWSQALIATKPVLEFTTETNTFGIEELEEIASEVRLAAQKIIAAKRATYYGIGMSLVRITRAILGDEHSILTVSSMLRGEFGQAGGVFVGVPTIVGKNGAQKVLPISMTQSELDKFAHSCDILRETYSGIKL